MSQAHHNPAGAGCYGAVYRGELKALPGWRAVGSDSSSTSGWWWMVAMNLALSHESWVGMSSSQLTIRPIFQDGVALALAPPVFHVLRFRNSLWWHQRWVGMELFLHPEMAQTIRATSQTLGAKGAKGASKKTHKEPDFCSYFFDSNI